MSHRCGKHVLLSTPASAQSGWISCPVHRMGTTHLDATFTRIVTLEFHGEEQLRFGWIITHAMLDDA
ncbi:hypothetical protein ACFQY4_30895 [Catellatospora bangladeshensis]|uniref:Uncharacterized protein n=1 Tax=Catellatospora bangladeshensis TaxID=310355 RepID=A0A8J3JYR6_9ACTN|nr:hypothetical protein [Catellatospora bangladeshensis]GIF86164.1 hypothetical protein Cba03nite_75130 [Catellatospora bangladeshensis]